MKEYCQVLYLILIDQILNCIELMIMYFHIIEIRRIRIQICNFPYRSFWKKQTICFLWLWFSCQKLLAECVWPKMKDYESQALRTNTPLPRRWKIDFFWLHTVLEVKRCNWKLIRFSLRFQKTSLQCEMYTSCLTNVSFFEYCFFHFCVLNMILSG